MRLLEAGGERAEAELVAAEVLGLLRAGVPGEEIVVVHRSPAAAAALVERVFEQLRDRGRHRPQGRRSAHTPLGRGAARARPLRAARPSELAPRICSTICASPGILDRHELADGLEADVRREGLRTAAQARARLGWTLARSTRSRRRLDPAAELAVQARRLFAAPHRGQAPLLGAAEELDARALSALLRARWPSSRSSASDRRAPRT